MHMWQVLSLFAMWVLTILFLDIVIVDAVHYLFIIGVSIIISSPILFSIK